MTEIKAQEYLEKNWTDKNITIINSSETKLATDLIIQDYPNLEAITLPNHELTSLKVINCPNLKTINLRNNQLTKLELTGENITELIASHNELSELDLTNCPKISRLMVCDNPLLTKLAGLNLSNVKDINIINTLVNLAADYEALKVSKDEALKAVKTLKEAAEEKELVLTEAIQTSVQVEEAIQRLLKKTEKDWKYYLDNPDQALPSFQLPETRRRNQDFLLSIIQAKVSGNYQKLLEEWKIETNAEEIFADILIQLSKLLGAKSYLKNQEAQPLLSQNLV